LRRKCEKCGEYFWSKNEKQNLCGDAPCVDYTFIGNAVGKKMNLHEMREAFLSFFERHNHTRLKRYPVVARWRNDIYLTIASIADFQPHVTSGEVPPPANPLVISQPSIRLNDLEEVGRSGRHLTLFEMMGHHAFNDSENIYWTEETAEYCQNFLEEIGIYDATYKEAEWAGGGNAGACLEVLSHGLEIATLVFMNLQEDENGNYVIKGKKYSEMPVKVVDTGYGLERFVWLTNGSKTVYDAVFPEVVEMLKREAKKEMEYLYALADHARCLAFMLSDGIVPSNTGAGYLARLIIRRALRFMKKIEYGENLFSIVEMHIENLSSDFPELKREKDRIEEILEIETEKFYNSLQKGRAMVSRYIKKEGKISIEKLVEFYDSHGIHPEIVTEIADVEIPENFESMVAEKHVKAENKKVEKKKIYDFETHPAYYDDEYVKEFDAEVLHTENKIAILNKTYFYPEGGGQKSDTGYIIQNGKKVRVKKVEKSGNAILHFLDGEIHKGKVHCEIDWERRYAMMLHHTATHIINASARSVLGSHIWQAGSELDENEARLDVTHYKRISEEEVREIEKRANEIVRMSVDVEKKFMRRDYAEKKFGFRLYQGGAPKSGVIRVVNIKNIETEACGGTHVNNTSEIGFIKITGIERVQDGVERIKFCAGEKAIEYVHEQEKILREVASILGTQPSNVVKGVEKIIGEWKKVRKELENIQKNMGGIAMEYEGVRIIMQENLLPSAIKELTRKMAVVLSGSIKDKKAILTIACSEDLFIDCSLIAREVGEKIGGKGGGRKTIAQIGMEGGKLEEAKKIAVEIVKEKIKEAKSLFQI